MTTTGMADDYAWQRCTDDGAYAPAPVFARLMALAGGAERIVAFDAVCDQGARDTTWKLTWLIPDALVRVEARRANDAAWAARSGGHAGMPSGDESVESDEFDAAWLRPLSSVVRLDAATGVDTRRVKDGPVSEERLEWSAKTTVVFSDGATLGLPGPRPRQGWDQGEEHVSGLTAALRQYVRGDGLPTAPTDGAASDTRVPKRVR